MHSKPVHLSTQGSFGCIKRWTHAVGHQPTVVKGSFLAACMVGAAPEAITNRSLERGPTGARSHEWTAIGAVKTQCRACDRASSTLREPRLQAIGRRPQSEPNDAAVSCERHRPEQTMLRRLVQHYAATYFAKAEAVAGADLPRVMKDKFDAFPACGSQTHGSVRLRRSDCVTTSSWTSVASGVGLTPHAAYSGWPRKRRREAAISDYATMRRRAATRPTRARPTRASEPGSGTVPACVTENTA